VDLLGWPLFVKPAVSYASLSISDKSIVRNSKEALEQVDAVREMTWNGCGEVYVETFLKGREFTALVTGEGTFEGGVESSGGVKVYPVAERVFDPTLETDKRLLAFDRYWDGYDLTSGSMEAPSQDTDLTRLSTTTLTNGEDGEIEVGVKLGKEAPAPLYWYELAPAEWQEMLQDIARRAYIACHGTGYGRGRRNKKEMHPELLLLTYTLWTYPSFLPYISLI
jgi:hypothetical protein